MTGVDAAQRSSRRPLGTSSPTATRPASSPPAPNPSTRGPSTPRWPAPNSRSSTRPNSLATSWCWGPGLPARRGP